MADVRLKDPNSDFVAVVGSAIEAANLRAAGYTDVEDEPTSGEVGDGTPQGDGNSSGTENTDAGTQGSNGPANDETGSTDPGAGGKPGTRRR